MKINRYILIFFLVLNSTVFCQEIVDVEAKMEELSKTVTGLNEKVDLDVGRSTIQTFISALGKTHNLNVSIDPSLKIPISANFSNETVKNVLIYLINSYNLDVKFTGTIISFSKEIEAMVEDTLIINYNNKKLSFDLSNDNLQEVVKQIVNKTGENIIIEPKLKTKNVDGYIKDLDLKSALEKLAFANDFKLARMNDSTFLLKSKEQQPVANNSNKNNSRNNNSQQDFDNKNIELNTAKDINENDIISVSAINKPISDILKYIFKETGRNYIFFTEPDENITISVKDVPMDELLNFLLNTTDFAYKKNEEVYLFGLRSNEKLRNLKVVKLKYRAIEDVKAVIPAEISKGVKIDEFPELNSFILSGSAPNIKEVESLIEQIDQPVPVVMIELIIIDVNKTRDLNTGIEMGLSDKPVATSGTILPGLDVTLSSSSINSFLNMIGLANLGKVTPNFYVSLSLLEANGNINIQSTPRLSTLNSHEATLSIGETSYYLEQQQNVIGTQNPQTVITNTYKSVNADFAITINPVLSGDEHVTLDVDVNQSQFTGRIAPDAPPGQSNRQFKSTIRVKNEEMIVLGGLDRTEKSESGTGLPWISRIPILNWFFGKKQKTNSKNKLVIFIKPTIVY